MLFEGTNDRKHLLVLKLFDENRHASLLGHLDLVRRRWKLSKLEEIARVPYQRIDGRNQAGRYAGSVQGIEKTTEMLFQVPTNVRPARFVQAIALRDSDRDRLLIRVKKIRRWLKMVKVPSVPSAPLHNVHGHDQCR